MAAPNGSGLPGGPVRRGVGPGFRPSIRNGAALAMLFAAMAPWAGGEEPGRALVRDYPATAAIRFSATSTLHDFGGQLPAQAFVLTISNGTWSAAAKVPSGQMGTDNAKRDRKMREMMEAGAHPWLGGRVSGAAVPRSGAGAAATGRATLALRIRDKEVELPVAVDGWEETATTIRFRAAWELSLKAYGLQPPSVIGVIRVGDRVRLEADVTANKSPAKSETKSAEAQPIRSTTQPIP